MPNISKIKINNILYDIKDTNGFSGSWNDLTEKPFYEEVASVEKWDISATLTPDDIRTTNNGVAKYKPIGQYDMWMYDHINTNVVVLLNNVEYIVPVTRLGTAGRNCACGNPYLVGTNYEDNGLKFVIYVDDYMGQAQLIVDSSFIDTTNNVTFEVYEIPETIIKTIDDKFISENIARADSVVEQISNHNTDINAHKSIQNAVAANEAAISLLLNGSDPETIDSVNDLINYVTEHGSEVTGIKADIKTNSDAIEKVKDAVLYTEQELTDEQKAQARENIGAANNEDIVIYPMPYYQEEFYENTYGDYFVRYVDLCALETGKTYGVSKAVDGISVTYTFQILCADGTNKFVFGYQGTGIFSVIQYNEAVSVQDILNGVVYSVSFGDKSTADNITVTKSLQTFLGLYNTTQYTPTGDYNPATKKYVDDSANAVSALVGDTSVSEQISDVFDGHTHSWNDLTDKPFGEEMALTEKNVLINGNYQADSNGMIYSSVTGASGNGYVLLSETVYKLSINGVEYVATATPVWPAASYTLYFTDSIYVNNDMPGGNPPTMGSFNIGLGSEYANQSVDIKFSETGGEYIIQCIDEKFIPDTIARTADVNTYLASKADISHSHDDLYYTETEVDTLIANHEYSWNDLNDKPFGEESNESTLEISKDEFYNSYGIYVLSGITAPFILEEGETYNVTYDGEQYTCVATRRNDYYVYIGNKHVADYSGDTGEPFYIEASANTWDIYVDSLENHTITVSNVLTKILDDKYISDNIARVSDIEAVSALVGDTSVSSQISTAINESVADWNQTDESAPDYIKNKPEIATDDEIIELLMQEDMFPVVTDSDGSILADENDNILLW